LAADPLLRFRPEFPILERTTYLIFLAIDEIRASDAWQKWVDRPVVVT
jgi:hypothetical protein